jgi:hypothetical protein
MTGPEHYQVAEQFVRSAHAIPDGFPSEEYAQMIAVAQVHATLAVAAATALHDGAMRAGHPLDWAAWRAAAGTPALDVQP